MDIFWNNTIEGGSEGSRGRKQEKWKEVQIGKVRSMYIHAPIHVVRKCKLG